MRVTSALRYGAAALALAGLGVLALASAPAAQSQAAFVQNGRAGFIVSQISYALAPDSNDTGACPAGRSIGYRDIFARMPDGAQRQGETDQDYTRRVAQGAQALSTLPNGESVCMNPEAGAPDSYFRTVTNSEVRVDGGIDLDGQDSRTNGPAASGTCAHTDFRGARGERGIDNQFFRAVGCVNSFQPTGQSNTYTVSMYAGEWGILISLDGVDDIRNDDDVTVGFFANADPIQLSPNREPVPNVTYAIAQDPRYRATAHGRIVNGVLTTDPVDVRFWKVTNSIRLDRPLQDARLRATLSADGVLDGYLAGYTPADAMYSLQFAYRDGVDGSGQTAPLRLRVVSATGGANNNGFSCQGIYAALQQLADGHPDANGHCTSISTQYHIRAIPAFVVDTQTRSLNDDLGRAPQRSY